MSMNLESQMGDLLAEMPGARRALFAKYHLGGCQSCAFDDTETLAKLCERAELDPQEVLSHLLASYQHDLTMLITPAEVKQLLDAGEEIHWVDVRTREEHEAVSIAGTRFFTPELQEEIFKTKPTGRIVLYDHSGKYVLDQVAWFRGHKIPNAYGLTGGIDAWSQQVDSSIMRYRIEV